MTVMAGRLPTEGFRLGYRAILGPAVCQGCGGHVYYQQDAHGKGWRHEDQYGFRIRPCPGRPGAIEPR